MIFLRSYMTLFQYWMFADQFAAALRTLNGGILGRYSFGYGWLVFSAHSGQLVCQSVKIDGTDHQVHVHNFMWP